jgi:uncharacterized short protein YbdD (DUF466 family)
MWRVCMRETEKGTGRDKSKKALPRLTRAIRQIVGAPDYKAYVEHCHRAGHPVRLTEREYVKEFFERKGRTPRCC